MRLSGDIMRVLSTSILFGTVALVQPTAAQAVTAEVAKACSALLEKAFPRLEPGNPAAGSSAGTPQDRRRYFEKCVASGGRMDDSKEGK
jgi:hypothetical protein